MLGPWSFVLGPSCDVPWCHGVGRSGAGGTCRRFGTAAGCIAPENGACPPLRLLRVPLGIEPERGGLAGANDSIQFDSIRRFSGWDGVAPSAPPGALVPLWFLSHQQRSRMVGPQECVRAASSAALAALEKTIVKATHPERWQERWCCRSEARNRKSTSVLPGVGFSRADSRRAVFRAGLARRLFKMKGRVRRCCTLSEVTCGVVGVDALLGHLHFHGSESGS